jgi:hypothetical protein
MRTSAVAADNGTNQEFMWSQGISVGQGPVNLLAPLAGVSLAQIDTA